MYTYGNDFRNFDINALIIHGLKKTHFADTPEIKRAPLSTI